ncbi:MAG: serine protease [Acidobacteriota bacterium]
MRSVLVEAGLPKNWIDALSLSHPITAATDVVSRLEGLGRLVDRPTHTFLGAFVEYLHEHSPDLEGKLFLGLLLSTYELIEHSALTTLELPHLQLGQGQTPNTPMASDGPAFQFVEPQGLEKVWSRHGRFLDVEFLARGLACAESACLIEKADGTDQGSGFLLTPRHVMTNHHVVPNDESASSFEARFGFRIDSQGKPLPGKACPVRRVERRSPVEELDYVVLEISPPDGWSTEPLIPEARTLDVEAPVYIIQHPMGAPQKVVLQDNWITYYAADHRRCQYLASTRLGSSGAPVFDEQWRLVALHHSFTPVPPAPKRIGGFGNEGIPMKAILPEIQDLLG